MDIAEERLELENKLNYSDVNLEKESKRNEGELRKHEEW